MSGRGGGTGQGAGQVGGGAAGPGDDLEDLAEDLVFQRSQRVRGGGGLVGVAGGGAGVRGVLGGGGFGGGLGAELVVLDAQADEVFDGGGVEVGGDDGEDHRGAGEFAGGVAVEPGTAVPRRSEEQ